MDLSSKYFNQIDWRYVDHSSGLEPMQSLHLMIRSQSVGKDLSCNVVRIGFTNIVLVYMTPVYRS